MQRKNFGNGGKGQMDALAADSAELLLPKPPLMLLWRITSRGPEKTS